MNLTQGDRPASASGRHGFFDRLATWVTRGAGSPIAFSLALLTVIVWVVSGPVFHFSDTWQLVINTGTTIITFLMVFIIQQSQNKDSAAVHLKLDELLASGKSSNRLIGIEDLDEAELTRVHKFYSDLANAIAERADKNTHSLDELDDPPTRPGTAPDEPHGAGRNAGAGE